MVTQQATELRYAVRPRVLCRYFGEMCLIVAALSLMPLLVSLLFGDTSSGLRYGFVIGVLAAFGFTLARLPLFTIIVRSRTISRYLEDLVDGGENIELSTIIKDEARLFTVIAGKKEAVTARDLKLPTGAKVICYYREGQFSHVDEDTIFHQDDEIVILTHSRNIPALQERWQQ